MALEVINQVGPSGHYLTEPHTLAHFRQETWMPKILDRNNYDTWKADGKTTLLQRANTLIKQILETHQPEPLERIIVKEIKALADKENIKGG